MNSHRESPRFQVPDLKPGGHMMDVRTADGSVVKISAGNEQDLAKTLGVEMVQNMYKVNVEDINQLLAYHEVFGKLQSEIAAGTVGGSVPTQTVTTIQNGTPLVQQVQLNKFDIKTSDGEATPGPSASPVSVGSHACEVCGKIFQFRYQLIVHRRYHTERKPFTCQVNINITKPRSLFLIRWHRFMYTTFFRSAAKRFQMQMT